MRATPLLVAGSCVTADPYRAAQLAVWQEVSRSLVEYPRVWRSAEEGAMVLGEEVDELWEAVRHNQISHAADEAAQVGAMAVRFIADICETSGPARDRCRTAVAEQRAARAATGPAERALSSSHEGFGFLKREYDALWAAVSAGGDARGAAARVAALAVRFIAEIGRPSDVVDTVGVGR